MEEDGAKVGREGEGRGRAMGTDGRGGRAREAGRARGTYCTNPQTFIISYPHRILYVAVWRRIPNVLHDTGNYGGSHNQSLSIA